MAASILPLGCLPARTPVPSSEAGPDAGKERSFGSEPHAPFSARRPSSRPSSSSSSARRSVEEQGLFDLVMSELELRLPNRFRGGIFDLLRGRYSIEARPSAPASSALGILGSFVCVGLAQSVRRLVASLPLLPHEAKRWLLLNERLDVLHTHPLSGVVLLALGLGLGAAARNWFLMNGAVCRLLFLVALTTMGVSGAGKELVLGLYLGTWIAVGVVFKPNSRTRENGATMGTGATATKEPPEPADSQSALEDLPAEWVHERWLPGTWEVQLGGGWRGLPPDAQALLERAFKQHAPGAFLEEGVYGESGYECDLRHLVATNTSTGREHRLRRQAQHW